MYMILWCIKAVLVIRYDRILLVRCVAISFKCLYISGDK